ncbi:unnamed protein product [Arctogadus glacialis]
MRLEVPVCGRGSTNDTAVTSDPASSSGLRLFGLSLCPSVHGLTPKGGGIDPRSSRDGDEGEENSWIQPPVPRMETITSRQGPTLS